MSSASSIGCDPDAPGILALLSSVKSAQDQQLSPGSLAPLCPLREVVPGDENRQDPCPVTDSRGESPCNPPAPDPLSNFQISTFPPGILPRSPLPLCLAPPPAPPGTQMKSFVRWLCRYKLSVLCQTTGHNLLPCLTRETQSFSSQSLSLRGRQNPVPDGPIYKKRQITHKKQNSPT